MGIKFDFTDIHKAIVATKIKARERMKEAGENAVKRAVETGDYHDVTGHLRASNKYDIDEKGLRIYNDASYAYDVEARGKRVITEAALEAYSELERDFL